MTRSWGSRAMAAASPLLIGLMLFGCVAAPHEPSPPTADEVDAYNAQMLDLTWQNTGLGTNYYLPQGATKPPAAPREFVEAMTECYSEEGWGTLNMSSSSEHGYVLLDGNGNQSLDAMKQISLFQCLAMNPADPVASGELVSESQREYLYYRYASWTLPCMRSAGYRVDDVPSRNVFVATNPQSWSPYSGLGELAIEDYDALVARCGNDWVDF